MSLRRQLLALFAALAVVPLLAVGVTDYIRSIKALEDVIASQTAVIAGKASDELRERYAAASTNLALFAENTAARQLLESAASGKIDSDTTALTYLRRLRAVTRKQFAWIAYRDADGKPVTTLDDSAGRTNPVDNLYIASVPIRGRNGRVIGRVDAAIRMDSVFPRPPLDARFGRGGRTVVVDTATGAYLYVGGGATPLPPFREWRQAGDLAAGNRRLTYEGGDSSYIGSLTVAGGTPFAVLSAGNVNEFSAPFRRIRSTNLFMVVLITASVATLFLLLLWRATHSLSQLTIAADQVGRGNFSPQLPARRVGEVGRLANAFALMITRVRDTLAEVERSRNMAAIGEFASQVSHEIRNPLTSIKLNLQTLERAAGDGGIRADLVQPVGISLREVNRLDRVVRGVLQLGRGRVTRTGTFHLHDAAATAADSMRLTFERRGIDLSISANGNGHHVRGDRLLVESALMNILLNASEAMPGGGTIRIVSEGATVDGRAVHRVRIEDRGPGVPREDRERIFSPFFTTKTDGSGLGLALAHRTVEEHDGRLWVEDPEDGGGGSAFVMELPVVAQVP
jgi:signal transduction histidine kinase